MKWFKVFYLAGITIALYAAFSNWAYDDPFITFRYAQNLAQGNGFVYNPGERVLSTTTPLFAMVLAVGSFIWTDIHHLAVLSGAACLGIGGWMIFELSRAWEMPWVGWAGLALFPTFPLLVSTLGSEMPLYLALCLGAMATYANRSYTLSGICCGFACLARPDGVLVPLLLAIDFIARRRERLPWGGILVFAGIFLLWTGFAWLYFGSPVPATLGAKQSQGRLAISEQFAPGFMTILQSYTGWPYILFACLVLVGWLFALLAKRDSIHVLLWPLAYFGAYTFLGVSRYFWYYAPLVPGFVIGAGLGLEGIRHWFRTLSGRYEEAGAKFGSAAGLALVVVVLLANSGGLSSMQARADNRYPIYRAAGDWLRNNTDEGASVGALEIGIIGYFAQRKMVDFAGLIQPDVAESMEAEDTYEDAALFALNRYHPDYLVLHAEGFPALEEAVHRLGCGTETVLQGEPFEYPLDLRIYACQN
jgi:hypothetical protein